MYKQAGVGRCAFSGPVPMRSRTRTGVPLVNGTPFGVRLGGCICRQQDAAAVVHLIHGLGVRRETCRVCVVSFLVAARIATTAVAAATATGTTTASPAIFARTSFIDGDFPPL